MKNALQCHIGVFLFILPTSPGISRNWGVTALHLLKDHQGTACHTKPLTVTSVEEEEAKGGVNRSW